MTTFYRGWLTIWCAAVAMFGLILTGGAFAATDGPVHALTTLLNPGTDQTMTDLVRFSLALMGAVTLGWALTLFAAIRAADRLGAAGAPVWRLLGTAMLVWFVVDSSLSVATGFGLNAVSNAVLLVAFLWPLWRSGVLGGGAATARA